MITCVRCGKEIAGDIGERLNLIASSGMVIDDSERVCEHCREGDKLARLFETGGLGVILREKGVA